MYRFDTTPDRRMTVKLNDLDALRVDETDDDLEAIAQEDISNEQ